MVALAEFNVPATFSPAIGVDELNRRLVGAVIMQLGEVDDLRELYVDDTTLRELVHFGNASKGVKCRFGHPPLWGDGLGTFLGRWSSFRRDRNKVRADLSFADIASNTPDDYDLAQYVMDVSDEDPEALGISIVVTFDHLRMQRERRSDGRQPIRMKALRAADVVDEPGATDGMFDLPSIESLVPKADSLPSRKSETFQSRRISSSDSRVSTRYDNPFPW